MSAFDYAEKDVIDVTRWIPAFLLVLLGSLALSPAMEAARKPRTFPKRVGGPELAFTADAVMVSGAQPGAQIHFAAVALHPGNYETRVEKPAGSAVADAQGRASHAVDVETRSVWIAVDASTRGYTVGSPHGMLLREMDFPGRGWVDNPSQLFRRLSLDRYSVDVFVIRPGVGVWAGNFRDGGAGDEDGAMNGETTADVAFLTPVGGAPALERVQPRDIVFLVDPSTLEFHVARRGE